MAKRENDLGRDPIGKLLLRLAVPTVTAQLVNALYNIVDRIYIGHIPGEGDLALTGLGICFPVILFVSAISALVGMVVLVAGQLVVERIYHYAVPISVFITVGGGVYFLYLLLSNRRV